MRWRERTIAVIDCETTGTDPAVDRVIEIGVALARIGPGVAVIEARSSWLVSGPHIPEESTQIHGITNDMTADAPPFYSVLPEVAALVGPAVCAGYNARFDRAMLIADALRTSATVMPPWLIGADRRAWIDAMVWAQAHHPYAKGTGRYKLGSVATRLGVEVDTAHRAEGDAVTAARVLGVLANAKIDGGDLMPDDLEELLTWQRILAAEREADFLRWLVRQPPTPTTPTEATTEPAA